MSEKAISWEQNDKCQRILERLRQGPATPSQLGSLPGVANVARAVWELRHWYGYDIYTERIAGGSRYTLRSDKPLAALIGNDYACPKCGKGVAALDNVLGGYMRVKCIAHGIQYIRP